jgi:NADH:ubiquinone oxidoreductase subunit F (NADH-binding)
VTAARLLAGTSSEPLALAEHLDVHGPPRERPDLVEAVRDSGLRGRGGASFPAAVKLAGAARRRGPRSVLVNGAEGEPMSAKDALLMELAPHLVLDGALAAASAIGARDVVIAVRAGAPAAIAAMRRACAERTTRCRVRVIEAPAAYLAGQEVALLRFADGGPLLPRATPPLPVERGLRGRPTLVQNAETLAHIALIDRHGADWFRHAGVPDHPGTALLTVAGAVRRPGVIEIECGTPWPHVLAAAGGATEPLQALLVGGYHGAWIAEQDLAALRLDDVSLAQHGATLAAGVIVALGASACPAREIAGAMHWLAGQIAGQCGPCIHGMPAVADLVGRVVAGTAPPGWHEQLTRWCSDLEGRGACHLPDGAMRFLASGLHAFGAEFADHAGHGPCDDCHRPRTLLVPPALKTAAAA